MASPIWNDLAIPDSVTYNQDNYAHQGKFPVKLTHTGLYAIRALVYLAAPPAPLCPYPHGVPVSSKTISGSCHLPSNFTSRIISNLVRRSNIVKIHRGPGSGYLLARSPESITLADVLDVVQQEAFVSHCPPVGVDPLNDQLKDICDECADIVRDNFFRVTLKSLVEVAS